VNYEAMLHPPVGYITASCVVGVGGLPSDTEHMLLEAGLDPVDHFGASPEAVLVAVYLETGSLTPLHVIVDLRCDAEAADAVALTIHPQTGRWCRREVPPEFGPLIRQVQARPF